MLPATEGLWTWLIEGCVVDIKMSIAGLHLENDVPTESKVTALIWNTVCESVRDGLGRQALLLPLYRKMEADCTYLLNHRFLHPAFGLAILVSARRKGEDLDTYCLMTLALQTFDAVVVEMGVMRTLALEKGAFRARYIEP